MIAWFRKFPAWYTIEKIQLDGNHITGKGLLAIATWMLSWSTVEYLARKTPLLITLMDNKITPSFITKTEVLLSSNDEFMVVATEEFEFELENIVPKDQDPRININAKEDAENEVYIYGETEKEIPPVKRYVIKVFTKVVPPSTSTEASYEEGGEEPSDEQLVAQYRQGVKENQQISKNFPCILILAI
jgi:hypothetical protein